MFKRTQRQAQSVLHVGRESATTRDPTSACRRTRGDLGGSTRRRLTAILEFQTIDPRVTARRSIRCGSGDHNDRNNDLRKRKRRKENEMDDINSSRNSKEVDLPRRYPSGLFCSVCRRLILKWVGPAQERPHLCVDCRRRRREALERRVTADQGVDSGAVKNDPPESLSDRHLPGMLRDTENHPANRERGGRPTSDAPSRHGSYRQKKIRKMSPRARAEYRASEVARVKAYRAAKAARRVRV